MPHSHSSHISSSIWSVLIFVCYDVTLKPMKSFFYLQRSDRRAVIVLLAGLVLLVVVLHFVGGGNEYTEVAEADTTAVKKQAKPSYHHYYDNGAPAGGAPLEAQLFAFDPNTADSTSLLRLGLSPRLVRNIYRYRAKGGVFHRKQDFARLYGLTVGQYRRLEPYIVIGEDYQWAADRIPAAKTSRLSVRDTMPYPKKLKVGEHIELNSADTSMLKRVPGIGTAYARAVVSYRERLGGYYQASQLLEIRGFPVTALQFFVVDVTKVRKININRLKQSTLSNHPYIDRRQAQTIVTHRNVFGPIKSLDKLAHYSDFTPDKIERLKAYVEF